MAMHMTSPLAQIINRETVLGVDRNQIAAAPGRYVGLSKKRRITAMTACAFRFGISGALTLSSLFVLCWLGAVIWPLGPSHMFIALFTAAPVNSVEALAVGGCAAAIVGALSGILLAWTYNLTRSFTRTSVP